ncbi:uncharacterized protein METZ01_LOCUS95604 [marine metagenome]|uniref:Uncharacterized protein n=1 Tax=marine metagenome TaxID=408172 RepID=A0A381VR03_9ZZZZ
MKKLRLIALLSSILVVVCCGGIQPDDRSNQSQETRVDYKIGLESSPDRGGEVGDIARDFSVTTIAGNEVTMSIYAEQGVLIYFFTTW